MLSAKEKHKMKLLKYLGNWENDFPLRIKMPGICGISLSTFYHHFSSEDLQEIEDEALALRKKNSTRQRAEVYTAMQREAMGGNVKAMKEFLDRTEGKVPDKLQADVTSKKIIIRRKTRDVEE